MMVSWMRRGMSGSRTCYQSFERKGRAGGLRGGEGAVNNGPLYNVLGVV